MPDNQKDQNLEVFRLGDPGNEPALGLDQETKLRLPVPPPPNLRRLAAGGLRVGSQIIAGIPANAPGVGSVIAAGIGGAGELGAQAIEEGPSTIFDKESLTRAGVEAGLAAVPGKALATGGRVLQSALRSAAAGTAGEGMREWSRGEELRPKTILGVGALSGVTGGLLGRFLPKTAEEAVRYGPDTLEKWVKEQGMDIGAIAKKSAEWQKAGMSEQANALRVAGLKAHGVDPKLGQKIRLEASKLELSGDADAAQGLRIAAVESGVQDPKLVADALKAKAVAQTQQTAQDELAAARAAGAKSKKSVGLSVGGVDPDTGKTIKISEKLVPPKKGGRGVPPGTESPDLPPPGTPARNVYDYWIMKGKSHDEALDLAASGAMPPSMRGIGGAPIEPTPTPPSPTGTGAAIAPPSLVASPEDEAELAGQITRRALGSRDDIPSTPVVPLPTPPPAPAGAAVAAETPVVPQTPVGGVLPPDLAGAQPRFNMGSIPFTPSFESDVDKAAFIISQTTKSKRDNDYLAFVMEQLGVDEAGARAYGQTIRERIKNLARNNKKGGVLRISKQAAAPTTPEASEVGKAAAEAGVVSKIPLDPILQNPNSSYADEVTGRLSGTSTKPEPRDLVPENAALLERRAVGQGPQAGGRRTTDLPAEAPPAAVAPGAPMAAQVPEAPPTPTATLAKAAEPVMDPANLPKVTAQSLKNLGYNPGVVKGLSPEQIQDIVSKQTPAPALIATEKEAIAELVIRDAYREVPELAERFSALNSAAWKAEAAKVAGDIEARPEIIREEMQALGKEAVTKGLVAPGFPQQVTKEIYAAYDDILVQKIRQQAGPVVEGGMAPIRINPPDVGMLPGRTPLTAQPEIPPTTRIGAMSDDIAARMQDLRARAAAGEDVTEEVNALQRELLGGAPPPKGPTEPPTTPPTGGAPKAPQASGGPRSTPQPIIRVLNTEGASTPRAVQQRLIELLRKEADDVVSNPGPQITTVKGSTPQTVGVAVDGVPVLEYDRRSGRTSFSYGTDDELVTKLGGKPTAPPGPDNPTGTQARLEDTKYLSRINSKGISIDEIGNVLRTWVSGRLMPSPRFTIQLPNGGTMTVNRDVESINGLIRRINSTGSSAFSDMAPAVAKRAPRAQSAESKAAEAFRVEREAAERAAGTPPIGSAKPPTQAPQGGGTNVGFMGTGFIQDLLEKNPTLANRLGTGALGAAAGAAIDPFGDPLTSAIVGGAAGFGLPTIIKGMKSIGVDTNDPDIAKGLTPGRIQETAGALWHLMPQIQRFNFLATEGLPANAAVGPFGSAVFGALSKAMAGDPRGKAALQDLFTTTNWFKDAKNGLDEAVQLIDRVEGSSPLIRAELHGPGLNLLPTVGKRTIQTPAILMTAGDLASRKALLRAGFTEQEAREITLTAEPFLPWLRKLANLRRGERSPFLELLFPFVRTPVNVLEQGLIRTPGVGFITQAIREKHGAAAVSYGEQAAQQFLGAIIGTVSYGIGTQMTPEQAKTWRRYVTNAAGPYSALAAAGFAAGQFTQRTGEGPLAAIGSTEAIREAEYSIPLPSTGALTDMYNFAKGQRSTAPGVVGLIQERVFGTDDNANPLTPPEFDTPEVFRLEDQ